jgi:hypothetical protein
VQRVIRPYLLTNRIDKALIILDQAKPHMTQELKSTFAAINCELVFIPARLTGVLQPADVSWFKPLKASYRKRWTDWIMATENHRTTRFGNVAGPSYQQIITWILCCWEELDSLLVKNSYTHCGLNSTQYVDFEFNRLFHYYNNMNQ